MALLTGTLLCLSVTLYLAGRAEGDDTHRCAAFARASVGRALADVGSGTRIAVVGDSYSVGLGLDRPHESWPARLAGRVHVDGFSGSGFSARASSCGRVSFADRVARAARGAELVVVEGGLNDHDRTDAEIRTGFERLARSLAGRRVLVVGPANAPARASAIPRLDRLLAGLAAEHGATYLRMSDLDLPYLDDRLHLTAAGHDAFGRRVAEAVDAELG